MRVVPAILMLTAIVLVAADAKDDEAKELKKLEGTWSMVSGEKEGKPLPEATVKSAKLTIKGNHHDVVVGEDKFKGTHKVDASKTPKTIDAMDTEGLFKGKTTLGIYEVTGDTFKVCFAPPDKDRPKEFTSKSGSGQIVHVWKRQK